jgi:hypothetical protein
MFSGGTKVIKGKRYVALAWIPALGFLVAIFAVVLMSSGSEETPRQMTVPSSSGQQPSAQQTTLPSERQTAVAEFRAQQTATSQAADPSIQATAIAIGQIARRNMLIEHLQGTVIAQSQSTPNVISPDLVLVGYRVEELMLPQPMEFESQGKKITTDIVWRLVIIGSEPFPIMTNLHTIYVDSSIIGTTSASSTNELRLIVPDRSVLVEGGTISLLGPNSPDGARVPDKLHFTTR